MRFHFDNFLNFISENWFPVSGIVLLTIHGVLFWYIQTETTLVSAKTCKNVEAIAKVLIKNQVLDPSDVQLSQNKINLEKYENQF